MEGVGVFSCGLACLKRYRHKGKILRLLFCEDRTAKNNKTRITARQRSPGFIIRIGDSMTIKHGFYQVPTPAMTGGGGRDSTGFRA